MSDTATFREVVQESHRGKMLPLLLLLLRNDDLHDITISFDQENAVFVVNAVKHVFCEEHSCDDEKCRDLIHIQDRMSFTLENLDEYLDAVFHKAYNE
ncbi:hypothetical protein H0W80_04535 [Candidatus Saccharibacteria bacterium]|nr:hypothetical protein [Candidatus Saccharibacteria bacterium]